MAIFSGATKASRFGMRSANKINATVDTINAAQKPNVSATVGLAPKSSAKWAKAGEKNRSPKIPPANESALTEIWMTVKKCPGCSCRAITRDAFL